MNKLIISSVLLSFFFVCQNICMARIPRAKNDAEVTRLSGQALSIESIEKTFKSIKKPRKGGFLNGSIRFKKYKLVENNIAKIKKHLQALKRQGKYQSKYTQDILKLLYDKLSWIDDFKGKPLKYFSSSYHAKSFFEKNDGIIGTQILESERKKND